MKKLIVSMLAITALSCAPKILTRGAPSPRNGDAAIQLFGRFAVGHACPCDGLILTAAHVAHPLYLRQGFRGEPISYAWSDHMGNSGYLGSAYLMLSRDLGVLSVLTVLSGTPHYYRHATEEPALGERVRWVEYDYRGSREAYAPRHRTANVVRLVAGHLILGSGATPGASGACLFNAQDQVIGIMVGRQRVGVNEYVSVAVSVAGPWWPGGQF